MCAPGVYAEVLACAGARQGSVYPKPMGGYGVRGSRESAEQQWRTGDVGAVQQWGAQGKPRGSQGASKGKRRWGGARRWLVQGGGKGVGEAAPRRVDRPGASCVLATTLRATANLEGAAWSPQGAALFSWGRVWRVTAG